MIRTTESDERVVEGRSPSKTFEEHAARYRFAARRVRGMRVLDLACGSGYGSAILHDAGAAEVIGLDRDPDAVRFAADRYGRTGVTFQCADALFLPPLPAVDMIVSFETIEHLSDPPRFLEQLRPLLRPGGSALISTPYRHRTRADGRPANPFHEFEWTSEEFADLLRPHFDRVSLYGQLAKVRRRMLSPPRTLAPRFARLFGHDIKNPDDIRPLPLNPVLGLWNVLPAYLIAVCG